MTWLQRIPVGYLFAALLLCGAMVGWVAQKLKAAAPLAFRRVNRSDYSERALLALELARNDADIAKILIEVKDRAGIASQLRGSLRYDNWLIPCYMVLLAAASLLAARQGLAASLWPLLALVVLAAAMDYLENYGISRALAAAREHPDAAAFPKTSDATARRIRRPSLVKWSLLALICLALGGLLFFCRGTGLVALFTVMAGILFAAAGFYCLGLLARWAITPGARW